MGLDRYRRFRKLIPRIRFGGHYWYSVPSMARDHARTLYTILLFLLRGAQSIEPVDASMRSAGASTAMRHVGALCEGSVRLGQCVAFDNDSNFRSRILCRMGEGKYDVIIGPAIPIGCNCLAHSLAQLIYNTPYDGEIRRAERRIADVRASKIARHGCPRCGPLGLSTWRAPAIECAGRRPEFYTSICVSSLDSGVCHIHGTGALSLILRIARAHFGPIWRNNVSALATNLISTYPIRPTYVCRWGGGGGGQTCACGARFRATESQPGAKMCQKCEGNARLYCACGVRFRPPVGDMGQKKRSGIRKGEERIGTGAIEIPGA